MSNEDTLALQIKRFRFGLGARRPVLELVGENGRTRDDFGPPGARPSTQ